MNCLYRTSAALFTLILASTSQAYERNTHRELSKEAAQVSVLQMDPIVLNNLGIKPSDKFNNSKNQERTLTGLFEDGADFEDDGIRPRHHFYDPINNRGLMWGIFRGEKSPDWALEDETDFSNQIRSLREARDYLYRALTGSEQKGRKRYFGLTFQTLGQVTHHIQDMAQPQHTRNDAHPPIGSHASLYEQYTDRGDIRPNLPYTGYQGVTFDQARKFWVTEEGTGGTGQGISEFTNNNFVSSGTNFTFLNGQAALGSKYFLPKPDSLVTSDKPIEQLLAERGDDRVCGPQFDTPSGCLEGEIAFVETTVWDKYTDIKETNQKASSLSIYDADLENYSATYPCDDDDDPLTLPTPCVADRVFTLNRFNFDSAHPFLIPRAVGYSAGLVDYFFCGRLGQEGAIETTNHTGANTWNV